MGDVDFILLRLPWGLRKIVWHVAEQHPRYSRLLRGSSIGTLRRSAPHAPANGGAFARTDSEKLFGNPGQRRRVLAPSKPAAPPHAFMSCHCVRGVHVIAPESCALDQASRRYRSETQKNPTWHAPCKTYGDRPDFYCTLVKNEGGRACGLTRGFNLVVDAKERAKRAQVFDGRR